MSSIIFEEGYKEYTINNDPNRVLRVNLSDANITTRIKTSLISTQKKIDELKNVSEKTLDTLQLLQLVEDIDKIVRADFDEIFYDGASEVVFGKMNPITFLDNGKTVYEAFMEALFKNIENELKKKTEKALENVKKYKESYKKYAGRIA